MSDPLPEYEDVSVDCGGVTLTVQRRNLLCEEVAVDTSLFEWDYTIAASTANNVWEGGYRLIDLIKDQLAEKIRNKRVVELGAGTGLAGLCAAAQGAHVLVTDVPSIVSSVISNSVLNNSTELSTPIDAAWPGARRVGVEGGTISQAPLDWTVPISAQMNSVFYNGKTPDARQADIIMAAETVWLVELVSPFVTTVMDILKGPRLSDSCGRKECYIAYRERTTQTSATFAGAVELLERFRNEGCTVEDVPHSFGPLIKVHCVHLY